MQQNYKRNCGQNRMDKKCAQKTSCKEWLHRWIVFVKNPRMCRNEGKFLSIYLGSYYSPVASGNISWDAIRILPEEKEEEEEVNTKLLIQLHLQKISATRITSCN
eukprot:184432_1